MKIDGKPINVKILNYNILDSSYNLWFLFTDQDTINFAYSYNKGNSVLTIPIIYKNRLESIKANFKARKREIIHELIHFLDERRKNVLTSSSKRKDIHDYINSPEEFNAFYQEAIEDIYDYFRKIGNKKGTWDQLKKLI